MNKRMVTSIGLVLLMLAAGCIGNVRDEIIIELPDDWKTKTSRTISQPQLVQFDSCDNMEYSLKASIAEEYRTGLLQAVEETYYWGGGWLEDGVVAEASMDGDTATITVPKSQPTRTEGKISVAPTIKNRGSMKPISSKPMDITSMSFKVHPSQSWGFQNLEKLNLQAILQSKVHRFR